MIAETTSMTPRDENEPWSDCVWTVDVVDFIPSGSYIRILSSGSTHLVFPTWKFTLDSMTIESTALAPAPIVTLMDTHFLQSLYPPAIGCNRAIYINDEHDAFLMRYALPNADAVTRGASYIQKHISPEFWPVIRRQTMDEDSGRVVIPDHTQIHVIDFALVFQ